MAILKSFLPPVPPTKDGKKPSAMHKFKHFITSPEGIIITLIVIVVLYKVFHKKEGKAAA